MSDPTIPDPATPESEPVIVRTIAAVVMSVLMDGLIAAGIHASPAWTALIAGAVNLLVLAGLAWAIRRRVFSPATVAGIIAAAKTPPAAASSSRSTRTSAPRSSPPAMSTGTTGRSSPGASSDTTL